MVHSVLHRFNGLFSRTPWVSRYQKGKTSRDLNEARDDGVLGCSGISWTICKQSAPRSRQIFCLTHVSFWLHVKTVSHIVSYRIYFQKEIVGYQRRRISSQSHWPAGKLCCRPKNMHPVKLSFLERNHRLLTTSNFEPVVSVAWSSLSNVVCDPDFGIAANRLRLDADGLCRAEGDLVTWWVAAIPTFDAAKHTTDKQFWRQYFSCRQDAL